MVILASILMVSVLLMYLEWRGELMLRAYWDLHTEVPAPVSAPVLPEDDSIPADLVRMAMDESEAWARESAFKAIRTLYDRTHNWDAVRRQLIRPFDADPEELH